MKCALLGVGLFALAAGSARAAVVHCDPPKSAAAEATCFDPDLLRASKAENAAYLSAQTAHPDIVPMLAQTEDSYVRDIVACASDKACLADRYARRLAALTPAASKPSEAAERPAPPPPTAPPEVEAPAPAAPAEQPLSSTQNTVADQVTDAAPPPTASPSSAPSPAGGALILLVLAAIPILLIWRAMARRSKANSAYWRIAREHEDTLGRRYLQLMRRNAYGVEEPAAWLKELGVFERTIMEPGMLAAGIKPTLAAQVITSKRNALYELAEHRSRTMTAGLTFDNKMTPREFEQFCAGILERNGWVAQLTGASGDQGVDVYAERGAEKLVLQCKLYNGPVGNKAVQEAHAAKRFKGANKSAVVTNAEFTPSARQLATTTGTILLHYTELAEL